jgi:hypothetical protein
MYPDNCPELTDDFICAVALDLDFVSWKVLGEITDPVTERSRTVENQLNLARILRRK